MHCRKPEDKKKLTTRLRRIEGQIRGIEKNDGSKHGSHRKAGVSESRAVCHDRLQRVDGSVGAVAFYTAACSRRKASSGSEPYVF